MTYKQVVRRHSEKALLVLDYENGLSALRGIDGDWEHGILQDGRHSVKTLYGALQRARIDLAEFEGIQISSVVHP